MARKRVPALALAFKGRWRIVAMDLWDKDAIDLVEPGLYHIQRRGRRDAIHRRARLAQTFATAAVMAFPSPSPFSAEHRR